ncbi:MAG: hypothetical protein RL264_3157 [Bacteroidota bacterium]
MNRTDYNNAVNKWSDGLFRFALSFLKNQEEAEDIVQDVFEKLWVNREKIEVEKVKSWLFTCAHNAMINWINKKARLSVMENESLPVQSSTDRMAFESEQVIDHIVGILPPLQRSILLLRDLEGYAYDEIGEMLHISESQVKVYLFRARMKIKRQLTDLNKYA